MKHVFPSLYLDFQEYYKKEKQHVQFYGMQYVFLFSCGIAVIGHDFPCGLREEKIVS
jgi:hypothetical protein